MREGRQLTRETRKFAQEKRGWSWWHFTSTLAIFVALISVTCVGFHWSIRLLASLLAALVHVRLFVIYHDHQHGAILQGSRIADAIFKVYGLFTLTPSSIWKHTHDAHHRNNQRRFGIDSIGSYPVLTVDGYRTAGLRIRLIYRVARHPLTIVFGYLTVFLYGFCIRPILTDARRHLDAILSIAVHGGVIAVLAVVSPSAMFFAVFLPSFLASALGSYLFYAQHNFPGVKLRPNRDWDYVFAALRSSSLIVMNPVLRWFTGNIGYHHVHHLNALIPFYRLPEAMNALEELQTPVTTTLRPRDMLRCLRLKLWDPVSDRMVSFREGRRAWSARARADRRDERAPLVAASEGVDRR